MKEKAKKFWEKNKVSICFGAICGVLAMAYLYGGKAGEEYMAAKISNAINRIATITPELAFGDFEKQCVAGTFDTKIYK